MEENNYPKYINNKPIGEDHFEGKSHERIATSIAEHIKDKNDSLRVLGIEGEWGSGKSNIIELLRNKLDSTHHIYIYDAWGHQEDSQRRAFLEELTEDLIDNNSNLLSDKTKYKDLSGKEKNITWTEKIKYLLARKRETSKKTIPKISGGVILIGLIIILTPILALMSDFIGDDKPAILLKILFSLSLLILVFSSWVFYSLYKRFISKDKIWANLSSVFYFYKGKELENTTLEVFSDLEPSVKEFKDWIKSISLGLVNKELVIVYDNMDRLPPEKVKEIWSSIHTFFAEQDYDKINVIIPFDRKHLQTAFEKEDNPTNQFINKTFSIIYRVTPPVLTDWKEFYGKKFETAFGDTEKDEFSTVLSVFDRLIDKFTPRDIIIFINELVTYKKIWKEEIPLRYIAVFIMKKESILDSPQKFILNGEYLGASKDLFAEDENLQNYISALTFNVPVEKASQVLLVRDLEITLRGDLNEDINDLAKHSHFIEILEEVIQNSELVVDKTIASLSKLDASKVSGVHVKERIVNVWNSLTAKQCALEIIELSFGEIFQSLLVNSSNRYKKRLLKYLIEGFNELKEISGDKYFNTFKDLEKFIEKEHISFNLINQIKQRSVSPELFLKYLSVAESDFEKYKLVTDSEELDNYVSSKLPDESELIVDEVELSFVTKDYSFLNTKENIENLIEQNKLSKDNFNNVNHIYKSISNDKPVDKLIPVLHLHPLLQTVTQEVDGYYDLIAMRLKYANDYNVKIAPHRWQDNTTSILAMTDENIVKEIAKVIEYYVNYGELLLLSTTWNQPLLSAVCKDLVLNSYGPQSMSINSVLTKFETIKEAIDVTEQELLNSLNGWSKYAKEKINIDNLKEVISEFSFFEYSVSISLDLTNYLNKLAVELINSTDEETLAEEWADDSSYIYNLLYIFMQTAKIKTLPRNIFNSIKQTLKQISESNTSVPSDGTFWHYFIEKSEKKDIAPTIRDIRDYYIRENNITNEQFIFFEKFFREYGKLNEKNNDTTRTILGKVVSDNQCFELIKAYQDFYIPIINGAQEDSADFKDNVLTRLESQPKNKELIEFASKIGVEYKLDENEGE
ncbi:P-loop NTPase fold protein [Flavicella marina]|uniref:P-loop NTPase fold protein n=1 Tax=Flavicella marina TaxID=1475951 RepID=UPI00126531F2|nr:P-loop NTPase fold protein [Flavicella marina]